MPTSTETPSTEVTLLEEKESPIKTSSNLEVRISTQVREQIRQVFIWGASLLLAVVFGGIVSALWSNNSKINEVYGKYSSPNAFIEHLDNQLDNLQKENNSLRDKIHDLENETIKLQAQKENNILKDKIHGLEIEVSKLTPKK